MYYIIIIIISILLESRDYLQRKVEVPEDEEEDGHEEQLQGEQFQTASSEVEHRVARPPANTHLCSKLEFTTHPNPVKRHTMYYKSTFSERLASIHALPND